MVAWLKRLVLDNVGLKVLSILLATMTWWIIQGVIGFEVQYNIPVEVDVADGIAVMSLSRDTVSVTFRGSQEDIRSLDDSIIRASVDLTSVGLEEGPHSVTLNSRNISGSRSVKILSIRPDVLKVELDQQSQSLVLVRPRLSGKPKGATVTIVPDHVLLSGPKTKLDDRKDVYTEEVDLKGKTESFTRLVKVLSPEGWQDSKITPSYVNLHVAISKKSHTKELLDVPVVGVIEPGRNVSIQILPARVNVTLHGGDAILKNISNDDIKLFVDCTGTDLSKTYERKVNVHFGSVGGVQTTVDPGVVKILIKEAQAKKVEPSEVRPADEESRLLPEGE